MGGWKKMEKNEYRGIEESDRKRTDERMESE